MRILKDIKWNRWWYFVIRMTSAFSSQRSESRFRPWKQATENVETEHRRGGGTQNKWFQQSRLLDDINFVQIMITLSLFIYSFIAHVNVCRAQCRRLPCVVCTDDCTMHTFPLVCRNMIFVIPQPADDDKNVARSPNLLHSCRIRARLASHHKYSAIDATQPTWGCGLLVAPWKSFRTAVSEGASRNERERKNWK